MPAGLSMARRSASSYRTLSGMASGRAVPSAAGGTSTRTRLARLEAKARLRRRAGDGYVTVADQTLHTRPAERRHAAHDEDIEPLARHVGDELSPRGRRLVVRHPVRFCLARSSLSSRMKKRRTATILIEIQASATLNVGNPPTSMKSVTSPKRRRSSRLPMAPPSCMPRAMRMKPWSIGGYR